MALKNPNYIEYRGMQFASPGDYQTQLDQDEETLMQRAKEEKHYGQRTRTYRYRVHGKPYASVRTVLIDPEPTWIVADSPYKSALDEIAVRRKYMRGHSLAYTGMTVAEHRDMWHPEYGSVGPLESHVEERRRRSREEGGSPHRVRTPLPSGIYYPGGLKVTASWNVSRAAYGRLYKGWSHSEINEDFKRQKRNRDASLRMSESIIASVRNRNRVGGLQQAHGTPASASYTEQQLGQLQRQERIRQENRAQSEFHAKVTSGEITHQNILAGARPESVPSRRPAQSVTQPVTPHATPNEQQVEQQVDTESVPVQGPMQPEERRDDNIVVTSLQGDTHNVSEHQRKEAESERYRNEVLDMAVKDKQVLGVHPVSSNPIQSFAVGTVGAVVGAGIDMYSMMVGGKEAWENRNLGVGGAIEEGIESSGKVAESYRPMSVVDYGLAKITGRDYDRYWEESDEQKEFLEPYEGEGGLLSNQAWLAGSVFGEAATALLIFPAKIGFGMRSLGSVVSVPGREAESVGRALHLGDRVLVSKYGFGSKPIRAKLPPDTYPMDKREQLRGVKLAAQSTKFLQESYGSQEVIRKMNLDDSSKELLDLVYRAEETTKGFQTPPARYTLGDDVMAEMRPTEGPKVIREIAKQQDSIRNRIDPVGGSISQRIYIPDKYNRPAGDVDVHIDSPKRGKQLAKMLEDIEMEEGRRLEAKGSHVELVDESGKRHKKVEYLSAKDKELQGSGSVQPDSSGKLFGIKEPKRVTTTDEGLRVHDLETQGMRKGESIASIQEAGKNIEKVEEGLLSKQELKNLQSLPPGQRYVGPAIFRHKDLVDWYVIKKTQVEAMRRMGDQRADILEASMARYRQNILRNPRFGFDVEQKAIERGGGRFEIEVTASSMGPSLAEAVRDASVIGSRSAVARTASAVPRSIGSQTSSRYASMRSYDSLSTRSMRDASTVRSIRDASNVRNMRSVRDASVRSTRGRSQVSVRGRKPMGSLYRRPPSMPPSTPPSVPPSVPPSAPPSTPPSAPPSTPPSTPPYKPPYQPPYKPPYRPPGKPYVSIPSSSTPRTFKTPTLTHKSTEQKRKPPKYKRRNDPWAGNTFQDYFLGFTGQSDVAYGRKQAVLGSGAGRDVRPAELRIKGVGSKTRRLRL